MNRHDSLELVAAAAGVLAINPIRDGIHAIPDGVSTTTRRAIAGMNGGAAFAAGDAAIAVRMSPIAARVNANPLRIDAVTPAS